MCEVEFYFESMAHMREIMKEMKCHHIDDERKREGYRKAWLAAVFPAQIHQRNINEIIADVEEINESINVWPEVKRVTRK